MGDTKNEFCFMMGYLAAQIGLKSSITNEEIEIAWAAYNAIPDGATYKEIDKAADSCVEDILAVRGSVKE